MHKPIFRSRPALLATLLFLGLAAFPLFGQDQQPAPVTQDSTAPAIRALELNEIPEFANTTRSLIRQVDAIEQNQEQLEQYKQELPRLDTVLMRKDSLLRDSTALYRLDRLNREEQEAGLYQQQLREMRNQLDEWVSQGQELDLQIDRLLRTWRMSLDSLNKGWSERRTSNEEELASRSRVRESINEYLSNLEESRNALNTWRNQIQNTQSILNATLDDLDKVKSLVEARKNQVVGQLWLPERPPIWRLGRDTLAFQTDRLDAREIALSYLNVFRNYAKTSNVFFDFVLICPIIVFLLIFYLRFKARQLIRKYPEGLREAEFLLRNPFFSTLIITWFLLGLFFDLPREVNQAIVFFMIIPVCYIYWKLTEGRKIWQVFVLAILYLTFLLLPNLVDYLLLQRIVLLITATGAFLVLLWFKDQKELIEENNSVWLGTLPFFVWLFMFLSLGAILGNVLGNVQLAQLLTRAILGTLLAYIILTEAVRLFRSLLFLLLLGPLHNTSYILKEDTQTFLKGTRKLLSWIALIFWALTVVELLSLREYLYERLQDFIAISVTIGEVTISVGSVLFFFLILQASTWLSRIVRYFLDKEVFPRTKMREGVPNTISIMVRFTFTIVGFLLAVAALGLPLDKISIALGALGVGIGFGLQSVANNFISGIILALERPIKMGDMISVKGGVSGIVKDVGLRASTIRAWDGSDVIVPNGELLAGQLINYTLSDKRRRLDMQIRVPFESDAREVIQLALEAAGEHEEVLERPGPYVNFEGAGDSAQQFKLYFWISDANDTFRLGTEVRVLVLEKLKAAGHNIPIPRQDVHLSAEQIARLREPEGSKNGNGSATKPTNEPPPSPEKEEQQAQQEGEKPEDQ